MKKLVATVIFSWVTFAFGQNCRCDTDTLLSEIISCDTIKFDNKAALYWSFNCDSSWLTFKSPTNKEEIIFSLGEGLQNMTGRLGYIYAQEYKKAFLIQNNVISGCCSPPDFYLYDKKTGELKANLGRVVFYSENKRKPFVIAVTNSNYDTTTVASYNSLTIYNIDNGKRYILQLPKRQIERALDATERIYPEYLFDEPIIKGDTVILKYYLKTPKNQADKPVKTITLDLKKYSS